jgi:hypothetical protein
MYEISLLNYIPIAYFTRHYSKETALYPKRLSTASDKSSFAATMQFSGRLMSVSHSSGIEMRR